MGSVATILVQNGTLRIGDCLVFGEHWGRVKTMRDEFNHSIAEAPPSTPIEITGLSGLPNAGEEFIAVASEKEARSIAEVRMIDERQKYLLQSKKTSLEFLGSPPCSTFTTVLLSRTRTGFPGLSNSA